jgi:hypothetical protein
VGLRQSAAPGRRLSDVPGRVQDGGGTMRCSRTQLDLGRDQKMRRPDQAHCGTTDATRTDRGFHAAKNGVSAGQRLFRWAGMDGL